jgi:DNA polymerase-3 subunit chi
MRCDFYLIAKPRFRDQPLRLVCELARRAFEAEQPLAILACSPEQAAAIDALLWSFDEAAFVAHQQAGSGNDALAPVLIVAPGSDAAARALVINLREAVVEGTHERVLEVVVADPSGREGSRRRWRAYQQRGCELHKHDM